MNINAKTLWDVYKQNFNDTFDVSAPAWSIKFSALLKKLINEQGESKAYDLVVKTIENWDLLKAKIKNLHGYPTVGVIWSFRYTFIDILSNDLQRNNSVEYDASIKKKKTIQIKQKRTERKSTKELYLYS